MINRKTQELCQKYFDYDPDFGVLTYKKLTESHFTNTQNHLKYTLNFANHRADTHHQVKIPLTDTLISTPKLMYFLQTGNFPQSVYFIDHNRCNYVFTNLTTQIPQPLPKQIRFDPRTNQFHITIPFRGKPIHFGPTDTAKEALTLFKKERRALRAERKAHP